MKNKSLWIIGLLIVVFSFMVHADTFIQSVDLRGPPFNVPENVTITNVTWTVYVEFEDIEGVEKPVCNWFARKLFAQDGIIIRTYWFDMNAKNNAKYKTLGFNPCQFFDSFNNLGFYNLNVDWVDFECDGWVTNNSILGCPPMASWFYPNSTFKDDYIISTECEGKGQGDNCSWTYP